MTEGLVETYNSIVNTWECDENAHLNVQFYLKRFDEAARFFQAMNGGRLDGPLPATRHIRFHAELRFGASSRVRSAVIADGRFAGFTAHVLDDRETGLRAATALDAPHAEDAAQRSSIAEADIGYALPRGIEPEPADAMAADEIMTRGGVLSHRSILQPRECSAAGEALEQAHVARFSDASTRVWEHAGLATEWLARNNCGRVVVEMKITHHRAARAGDGLFMHSLPSRSGQKTLSIRHEMTRLADGAPILSAELTTMVMDLSTRRSVPLPPEAAREAE